jgi:hypothetical protein
LTSFSKQPDDLREVTGEKIMNAASAEDLTMECPYCGKINLCGNPLGKPFLFYGVEPGWKIICDKCGNASYPRYSELEPLGFAWVSVCG